MAFFTEQIVFIFRIFLALVCGVVIGYERKNRGKGAGIRTHAIVALASALMMIVSKYGFSDLTD
ncbi:MAG: MgtC/SapB family protein, partial [Clostridia bacterium]|nr:MgtC/SapB family protein [Clostridia bacterium]